MYVTAIELGAGHCSSGQHGEGGGHCCVVDPRDALPSAAEAVAVVGKGNVEAGVARPVGQGGLREIGCVAGGMGVLSDEQLAQAAAHVRAAEV